MSFKCDTCHKTFQLASHLKLHQKKRGHFEVKGQGQGQEEEDDDDVVYIVEDEEKNK